MTGPEAIAVIGKELHRHERIASSLAQSSNLFARELLSREHYVLQVLGDLLTRLEDYERSGESPDLVDAAAAILRGGDNIEED